MGDDAAVLVDQVGIAVLAETKVCNHLVKHLHPQPAGENPTPGCRHRKGQVGGIGD